MRNYMRICKPYIMSKKRVSKYKGVIYESFIYKYIKMIHIFRIFIPFRSYSAYLKH